MNNNQIVIRVIRALFPPLCLGLSVTLAFLKPDSTQLQLALVTGGLTAFQPDKTSDTFNDITKLRDTVKNDPSKQ